MNTDNTIEPYVAKVGRPIRLILDDSTAEVTASTDNATIIKRQELEKLAKNGYTIKALATRYGMPYTTFHSFLVREGILNLFVSKEDTENDR